MGAIQFLPVDIIMVIKKRKIVIALNSAWNILNFREGLIKALVANGYQVYAMAPLDKYADQISDLGCQFIALPLEGHGTNPMRDVILWWRYRRLLKALHPDVFLGFTVKPNVFGSLAAHSLGIPVVNNISGLGTVFTNKSWLTFLVKLLYRIALFKSKKVFFQNQEDLDFFVEQDLVKRAAAHRLPGSGVNLIKFQPPSSSYSRKTITFLLISRMLFDKGVSEYVRAAMALKKEYPDVEFAIVGSMDSKNPSAIGQAQMDAWISEGSISYWGSSSDVRKEIGKADVVVLPSYREGTPRALLEAAAMGKPIVTTNAVGCRDVVVDGQNGYLCLVADVKSLIRAMKRMLELDYQDRIKMGQNGRKMMELFFDERFVIDEYLKALDVD
jgi:glycosyltransferase involved in cell wall biosynthesis